MGRVLLLVLAFIGSCNAAVAATNTTDVTKLDPNKIETASVSTYVTDLKSGKTLFQKNADIVMPIASITKIMTAMVVLDAELSLKEKITFDKTDKERIYNGYSRIRMESQLSRGEAIHIALMSSENLASAALADNYPGGYTAFVEAMNAKAKSLRMDDTHFVDSSGLSPNNVSTAADITKMVKAAYKYPKIRQYSTTPVHTAYFKKPRYKLGYTNTNALARGKKWNVELSKTGYLDIAGYCLTMVTNIDGKKLLMVMLDAYGKLTPIGDAGRIKKWIQTGKSGNISDTAEHYQRTKLAELTK
ncbi:D-alanyl-D-alanine endopeptidase [Photobacterium chitinilyticum]|uniref:D-alanyl-D-alanine endopeptidase n=1 Tax=Photobacterium chitinilyticum TaxID=2485123 RepID=A0A444JW98_9GAMM|nr:D-alanyl-D-alanine endopeptidase [Photobacterium chitinilyticum]RWX57345.1 D-alanyl-D-alanine endopeptidase [Photobacterium chitinilyticum]